MQSKAPSHAAVAPNGFDDDFMDPVDDVFELGGAEAHDLSAHDVYPLEHAELLHSETHGAGSWPKESAEESALPAPSRSADTEMKEQLDITRDFSTKLQKKVQEQAKKIADAAERIALLEQELQESRYGWPERDDQHRLELLPDAQGAGVGLPVTAAGAAGVMPHRKPNVGAIRAASFAFSETAKFSNIIRDKDAEIGRLEKELQFSQSRLQEYSRSLKEMKAKLDSRERAVLHWRRRAQGAPAAAQSTSPRHRAASPSMAMQMHRPAAASPSHQIVAANEQMLQKAAYLEAYIRRVLSEKEELQKRIEDIGAGLKQSGPEDFVSSLQVAEWKGRCESLRSELSRLKDTYDQQQRAVAGFATSLQEKEQEIDRLRSSAQHHPDIEVIRKERDELLQFVRESASLRKENDDLRHQAQKLMSEIDEHTALQSELLTSLQEAKRAAAKMAELDQICQERGELITRLNRDLKDHDDLRLSLAESRKEVLQLRDEMDGLVAQNRDLSDALDRADVELAAVPELRAQVDQLTAKVEKLANDRGAERRALQEEIAALKIANEVEWQKRMKGTEEAMQSMERMVSDLEGQVQSLNREADNMELELQEKDSRIAAHEAELGRNRESADFEIQELQNECRQLRSRVAEYEARLSAGSSPEDLVEQLRTSESLRSDLQALYDDLHREKHELEKQFADIRLENSRLAVADDTRRRPAAQPQSHASVQSSPQSAVADVRGSVRSPRAETAQEAPGPYASEHDAASVVEEERQPWHRDYLAESAVVSSPAGVPTSSGSVYKPVSGGSASAETDAENPPQEGAVFRSERRITLDERLARVREALRGNFPAGRQ